MPERSNKLLYLYRRWLKKKKLGKVPGDVQELFKENSKDGRRMEKHHLSKFLVQHQGKAGKEADGIAQSIITTINSFQHCRRKGLSLNGFLQFLLGDQNSPLSEKEFKGDEILAHYYVYTSHRSYLKQKKINQHQHVIEKGLMIPGRHTSDENEHKMIYRSTNAIKKTLENGARAIELDLCPSSDKSDIHVRHPRSKAHQSHSSVTLQNCLEAINERAFSTTDFPLILILVEHFDSGQSAQEASDLRRKINMRIHKAFGEDNLCSPATELTTLNSLKRKIIILTRHQTQGETNLNQQNKAKEDYANGYIEELKGDIQNLLESEDGKPKILSSKDGKPKILSVTENKLEDMESSNIISCTQNNLLAVYPNLDSDSEDSDFPSNFDPLISWTRGVQMVAFNMQDDSSLEKYLWIMQGLFRAHGATGYVKKPNILLDPTQNFDPEAWRPIKKILKVKVYLGTGWHLDFDSEEFDENSHPDFFTAIEIVGVPADEAREKTLPATDQQIPTWDQEFEFPLTVPELAMLVIEVRDFDSNRAHEFGGQTCLPVSRLRNGIRCVLLYDKKGKPYRAARLLVRFQLY